MQCSSGACFFSGIALQPLRQSSVASTFVTPLEDDHMLFIMTSTHPRFNNSIAGMH
jgi:hypothetical protein